MLPVRRVLAFIVAISAAGIPAPVAAQGAGSFAIVNQTGLSMSDLTIRRYGTQDWRRLGTAPSPGGRGAVDFKDPDCAFDIQAFAVRDQVAACGSQGMQQLAVVGHRLSALLSKVLKA